MLQRALILVIVLFPFTGLFAQIHGKVIDESTKESIIGAVITIKELNKNHFVGLDGSYHFKSIPAGNYTFVCQHPDYFKQEKSIIYKDSLIKLDFELKDIVKELDQVRLSIKHEVESDKFALNREKNADNIINVVSAKTIQLLPDITTAGILQRVSAVTLEKTSTGDARYAVIRGMDQRYNYTLVNGIKIPSPDNKYRYVPMDMFPAELLERLEVIKALTPNQEGDAIGGAMNLIMKSAPEKFTLNANIGGGFSQLLNTRGYTNFNSKTINFQSPSDQYGISHVATPNDFTYRNFDYSSKSTPINGMAGLSVGNRFLKNKQLGIILAGSYQNLYRGSNSLWFRPENQPAPGNVPAFTDAYSREYNTQQKRMGLHSKIDYVFSPNHKLSLYNLYMQMDEIQYRHTVDTSLSIGRSGVGTGNTYILFRSMFQRQSIYNSTLQGDHTFFKKLKLNWSGVYSLAKSETPDWSEYQTVHVVGFDINGKQTATPEVLNIPFYRIWTRNTDKDLAGYLNLSYSDTLFGKKFTLSVGGLYRDKKRSNNYNEWNLIPKTSELGQAVVFDNQLTPDKFQFNGTTAAQGSPKNPLTYSAYEKILAYYVQADINLTKKLSIVGGVRVENTNQGWTTVLDPMISYGAYGRVPYTDFLPSIHVKYKLTSKQSIRLSYFTAINRPGFFEYVPFLVNSDNFSLSGNPLLKHAISNNYDLRYEFFPKGLDQILIGGFYKDITNPIESAIQFNGTSSATLKPYNFGTAKNFGVEIAITKYWGEFGLSGNYTYTDSKITTSKLFYDKNFIAVQTTQTRPLQGQAPHIANLSALYKNQKIGLDLQIAGVFTGSKMTLVSPYKDLDYWQKAMFQLDVSIEKKIGKFLVIYCKASNLLNTPTIVQILQPNIYRTGKFALTDQTSDNKITVQKDYFGQNIVFGIRFKNLTKQ